MKKKKTDVYIVEADFRALSGGKLTKVIAYLVEVMTICINDLSKNMIQATIPHDAKIDYLELNPGGNKLLFRDKRK